MGVASWSSRISTSSELELIAQAGFPFTDSLVHVFVGGSALHGAKLVGTDDCDIYGLFIEPPRLLLGIDHFEHFVWSTAKEGDRNTAADVDITLYSLRKWAAMAVKGNPTALHFLYTPGLPLRVADGIKEFSPRWTEVASERRLFISKHASKQFMGFCDAQLGRLQGTRGQGKKGQRPELEQQFGYDVKAGMHAVRLMHECIELMDTGYITLPRPEKELLIHIRSGGWSLDRIIREINLLFVRVKLAVGRSSLPEMVDRQAVSELIARVYQDHWRCSREEDRQP